MELRKKAGLFFLGRIPKRDCGIRDNVDGIGLKIVCPMTHQAQRMEQVRHGLARGHHGRDVLANKWNP
eukprot:675273-Pyramimonas_sp.AAC.1